MGSNESVHWGMHEKPIKQIRLDKSYWEECSFRFEGICYVVQETVQCWDNRDKLQRNIWVTGDKLKMDKSTISSGKFKNAF